MAVRRSPYKNVRNDKNVAFNQRMQQVHNGRGLWDGQEGRATEGSKCEVNHASKAQASFASLNARMIPYFRNR